MRVVDFELIKIIIYLFKLKAFVKNDVLNNVM